MVLFIRYISARKGGCTMCKNTLTAMAVFKIFLSPFICFLWFAKTVERVFLEILLLSFLLSKFNIKGVIALYNRKDLLGLRDLSADEIMTILNTAKEMKAK